MISLDEQRRLEALRLAVSENRSAHPAAMVVKEAEVFYGFLSAGLTVDVEPGRGALAAMNNRFAQTNSPIANTWGEKLNEHFSKVTEAVAGSCAQSAPKVGDIIPADKVASIGTADIRADKSVMPGVVMYVCDSGTFVGVELPDGSVLLTREA